MTALYAVEPREPIAAIESEYALIAVLLYDSRRVDQVADILRAEDFCEPIHGRMFGIIVREFSAGNPLSALSIRTLLAGDPAYEALGGWEFLVGMTSINALLIDHRATARQIRDLAKRREFLASLADTITLGQDLNENLDGVVELAEAAVVAVTDLSQTVRQPTGAEAMRQLMKAAESPKRSINSGIIPSIDELLGGMRPKQLIIGGGRPGMGKTAAALSYALGAAQNGHGVLFVSLEMGATELAARMAADLAFNGHSGVPYADINSDNPSRRAFEAMQDAERMLADMPFQIIDAGGLTLAQLELRIRRYKRRFAAKGQSLDLVIVDYLQLLRTDDKNRSAYEAVSEISRRLKAMAKDQDVAVFALAQLSRAVEQRADKKPVLSDLRESGQIEQDADAVLFFYRHAYYLRQALPASEDDPMYAATMAEIQAIQGTIEFICGKRRNGVTGSRQGEFHGQYQAVRG